MFEASESRASAGRFRSITDSVARNRRQLVRDHGAPWRGRAAAAASEGPVLWTRHGPAGGVNLERAIWLTPYAAETMVEDVFGAGPDARFEVTVARNRQAGAPRRA